MYVFMFWVCILGERVANGWASKVHANVLYDGYVVWVLCHPFMVHFIQMSDGFWK